MTHRPELLDIVELVDATHAPGRRPGEQGTVVECLPRGWFIVEFDQTEDDDLALHDLPAAALRVVWRNATRAPVAKFSA
ncbi:MAG: DUF4926 domain-containing protein [Tepidiformaceae bacterium]